MQTAIPVTDPNPPPGFIPMTGVTPAEVFCGPFYVCEAEGDRPARLGFRVQQHHLNGAGVCHGGILSLFADLQGYMLPQIERTSGSAPTITISVDFLAPAKLGDWVEGTPECVKATRKMIFFQSVLRVGEDAVARCNGIYKLVKPR
ncbi:PaaI family thioesterase [Pontitalea aquivivens]|uniref:PaaI family thioesterase n=1 Tax=Pontitalea aquivivens TaxID=3388663 RepID=UPI003970F84F